MSALSQRFVTNPAARNARHCGCEFSFYLNILGMGAHMNLLTWISTAVVAFGALNAFAAGGSNSSASAGTTMPKASLVGTPIVTGTQTIAATGTCSSVSVTLTATVTGVTDDGGGVDNVYFQLFDDNAKKGEAIIAIPLGQTLTFTRTITFEGLYATGAPGVGVYLADTPTGADFFKLDPFFPADVAGACAPPVATPVCNPTAIPNPVTVLQSAQLQAACTVPATGVARSFEWVEGATRYTTTGAGIATFVAQATPGVRRMTLNVCDKRTTSSPDNNLSVGGLTGCAAVLSRPLDVTTVGLAATCSSLTASPTGNRPIGSTVTLTATCSGTPAITDYTWFNASTNVELGRTTANTFAVVIPAGGITVRVLPDNGVAGATGQQIVLAVEQPVLSVVGAPTVVMTSGPSRQFQVSVKSSTGVALAGVTVLWTDVEQATAATTGQSLKAFGTLSGGTQTVTTDSLGIATISYTFPAGSRGRLLTAAAAGASVSYKLVSAAVAVTEPAQAVVQAIAQVALVAPQVQLSNIRTRLEQLRNQSVQSRVKSDLRVSASGTSLPIGAITDLFDASVPARGLNGSADDFERWGVFLNGDVELGSYSPNNGFRGFEARTRGITLGADYRFDGNHAIGIGLGAVRAKAELAGAGGQQESRGSSVSLFGMLVPSQDTYIDGAVLFGRLNYDLRRAVLDANNVLLGTATAKPDGNQLAVAVSAGANFNLGSIRLNPYGRFEHISARIGAFAESGLQALSVSEQRVAVDTISAGAQAVGTFNTSFAILQPSIRLEYNRNIRDSRRIVFASMANDADPLARFALATALDDKSYGTIGVGLSFLFQRGISAFMQIEETFSSETSKRRRYSLGVRIPL